jgi:hypothetical protein
MQPLPHVALVFITFRRVDVAIPEPECLLDGIDADTASQLPGAKTD